MFGILLKLSRNVVDSSTQVLTFPLSSWLCQSGLDGGWPMTFYAPGTTGLVWCALFYLLIYSSPRVHPRCRPDTQLAHHPTCWRQDQQGGAGLPHQPRGRPRPRPGPDGLGAARAVAGDGAEPRGARALVHSSLLSFRLLPPLTQPLALHQRGPGLHCHGCNYTQDLSGRFYH